MSAYSIAVLILMVLLALGIIENWIKKRARK